VVEYTPAGLTVSRGVASSLASSPQKVLLSNKIIGQKSFFHFKYCKFLMLLKKGSNIFFSFSLGLVLSSYEILETTRICHPWVGMISLLIVI
jgi:hypothetical protein